MIFSVDMFNEGVDIPDVDMVLFLRPTESPVVYTLMDDDIYDLCRRNSAENIFKNYLPFLESLGRLMPEEKELYGGLGRDFLHLLETTSMTKVYKMPVLRAFYHHGDVRMAVTDEELLTEWKAFFGSGTNWKDLKPEGTYEDYLAITDKAHFSNILSNPVHFLQKSGKGFLFRKRAMPWRSGRIFRRS